MRIYNLKRGDKFKIDIDEDQPETELSHILFTFEKVDGSYSICFDETGNIEYLSAYTSVILED